MLTIGLQHYLVVSAILFSLGALCLVIRKNAINVLMGVELIFNSASINLVAFGRYSAQPITGQVFTVFVVMIAAAEVAVALALVLTLYKNFRTVNLDGVRNLKW